jgi:hypothetical protein
MSRGVFTFSSSKAPQLDYRGFLRPNSRMAQRIAPQALGQVPARRDAGRVGAPLTGYLVSEQMLT